MDIWDLRKLEVSFIKLGDPVLCLKYFKRYDRVQ